MCFPGGQNFGKTRGGKHRSREMGAVYPNQKSNKDKDVIKCDTCTLRALASVPRHTLICINAQNSDALHFMCLFGNSPKWSPGKTHFVKVFISLVIYRDNSERFWMWYYACQALKALESAVCCFGSLRHLKLVVNRTEALFCLSCQKKKYFKSFAALGHCKAGQDRQRWSGVLLNHRLTTRWWAIATKYVVCPSQTS